MWCHRSSGAHKLQFGETTEPAPPANEIEHGRRGFALLLVIWVLALVALIAAAVAVDSTSGSVIARNRLDIAQARSLADSGVSLAIAGLLDRNRSTRWAADASVHNLSLDGGTVAVTVQDEGGKIDLNDAPPVLISGLADEFHLGADVQAALVRGVLNRRKVFLAKASPPAARVFRGANNFDLAALPFAHVSEILLLPGVTLKDYRRIAPFLTVYARSTTLNPVTASRAALLAVPGISAQDVEFYLARSNPDADQIHRAALSGVDRYVQAAPIRAVTIVAKAVTNAGAIYIRQAVILLTPQSASRPYRTIGWEQLEEDSRPN